MWPPVPGLDPKAEEAMTQVTPLDKFIQSSSTFSCHHLSSMFIETSVGYFSPATMLYHTNWQNDTVFLNKQIKPPLEII